MKIIKMSNENWEPAISDGLTLPCGICNRVPKWDYNVDADFWNLIMHEHPHKRGVICLPCLDKLAVEKGYDVSTHLQRVQFTGIGKTIELKPSRLFQYEVLFQNRGSVTSTNHDSPEHDSQNHDQLPKHEHNSFGDSDVCPICGSGHSCDCSPHHSSKER